MFGNWFAVVVVLVSGSGGIYVYVCMGGGGGSVHSFTTEDRYKMKSTVL